MNNRYILFPVLIILGIAAGAAMMYGLDSERGEAYPVQPSSAPQLDVDQHPMASTFVITQVSDTERIQMLEQQVEALTERIEELEGTVETGNDAEGQAENGVPVIGSSSTVDTPVSSLSPAVTTANLVKAGIDEELARDIVRRSNEIDLKLLELRDRASREGYFRSDRYAREASELREQNISLRDEIGDDYYDNYLYASGQTNRVKVASVMLGSPAETAGMRDGDLILNYDNRTMFNWNELQQATSRGERGEYVNVTVLRNGQLLNLWMPRGPLGIRLGSARVQP